MRTIVYVDGFNLYYGAVKGTTYKWLDILRLCQYLLPKNEIIKIKYFTALVTARPSDPDQPNRQLVSLLVDLYDMQKYPKNWYKRRNKFDLKKITPL